MQTFKCTNEKTDDPFPLSWKEAVANEGIYVPRHDATQRLIVIKNSYEGNGTPTTLLLRNDGVLMHVGIEGWMTCRLRRLPEAKLCIEVRE